MKKQRNKHSNSAKAETRGGGRDFIHAVVPEPPERLSALRIGRGLLRGRQIKFADQPSLRPTLTRVREAVLSMVTPQAASHGFIDLCAGSGILGFEAASMGFSPLVMLDASSACAHQLRANAEILGLVAEIHGRPAEQLNSLGLESKPWVIYADPPYGEAGFHGRLLALTGALEFIAPGSLYLAETDVAFAGEDPLPWTRTRIKRYGRVHITVFEKLP